MKRLILIFPLAAAATLLAFVFIGLRVLVSSQFLPVPWKIAGLAVGALLALAVGLSSLLLLRRRQAAYQIPTLLLYLLMYGLPFFAFILPAWLLLLGTSPSESRLWSLVSPSGLASGQPWFFLWLVCAAGGFALFQRLSTSPRRLLSLRLTRTIVWELLTGALCGLGLGLAGGFLLSLELAALPQPLAAVSRPPAAVLILAAALIAAPWAEGTFFWEPLTRAPLPSGNTPWRNITLFALLQFRPALFLPAFLLGTGAALLARRTGHLWASFAAHAVFNLVMFLLGWYLVV
jgi:hypothetical protein